MTHSTRYTALLLAGLMTLLASGCHRSVGLDEEESRRPGSGATTQLTMQVSLPRDGTRAAVDQSDADGAADTGEGKVRSMSLWVDRLGLLSPDRVDVSGAEVVGRFTLRDLVRPVTRRFAVLLNRPSRMLITRPLAEDTVSLEMMSDLTDARGFLMTSTVDGETTIQPDVRDPEDESANTIPIAMERVVAKAQLHLTEEVPEEDFMGDVPGKGEGAKLRDFTWTVVGGARSAYLYRDHAGERTMTPATGLYRGLTTYSAEGHQAGSYPLVRLSDYGKRQPDGSVTFPPQLQHLARRPLAVKPEGWESDRTSTTEGIYFLEHALRETRGADAPYPETVTYADITCAKVYARYTDFKGRGFERHTKKWFFDVLNHHNAGIEDPNQRYILAPMNFVYSTREEAEEIFDKQYFGPADGLNFEAHYEGPIPVEEMKGYVRPIADVSDAPPVWRNYFREHRWYWVDITRDAGGYGSGWHMLYDINSAKSETFIERIREHNSIPIREMLPEGVEPKRRDHVYFLMHDEPGDFYLGSNGIIYDTLLAAIADGVHYARKYYGGRMVWYVPLHAEMTGTDESVARVYNADTRRNNIYDLQIWRIDKLGYNIDPVDPTDPYLPLATDSPLDIDNPLEPVRWQGIDEGPLVLPMRPTPPPVNKTAPRMRVRASILKWNYIRHAYDLKEPPSATL